MRISISFVLALCVAVNTSNASVIEYNNNKADWMAAAGPYTQIDFTGFPEHTLITTQYAALGVQFTDGIDLITHNANSYPNDEWGLRGAFDEIAVAFAQPMYALGVDHPGSMKFRLYWQGDLIYTSSDFVHVGVGFFSGLISDIPFDSAVILDPTGSVFIDDLYFGPPIPAPHTVALLALISLGVRGRRRTEL